ncbi:hypothetical protein [Micromonospora sp. WMMD812]|uniref:hypothetical protein n=1 Tax=Micromonospora sp. WMMD812 TaxID=3015152 RepID=UPI00248C4E0D|nr:hypothetical protein [Micromonospora sp. WMMD812]WBB70627.1 hypothetical protein O7603_15275 [Micromonospora sp. WMMD812]
MTVLHQPRVAWDTARVFVGSVYDEDLFTWLSAEVGELLGPADRAALGETRERLRAATDQLPGLLEAGRWRVRLEDVLRGRPELAEPLRSLTAVAAGVLRERAGGPLP